MNRFLPREKMSKREKRTLDNAKRQTWEGMNPVTRTSENKKIYNRKKSPRWYNDDSTGIFSCVNHFYQSTVSEDGTACCTASSGF